MSSAPAAASADQKVSPSKELAWRSINTIRALSMDAVEAANSGHPGTPMALAPAAYVLWHRFLRHNPANPGWDDRDRFVLSCGHASMLLYSLLHLTGYDLPLDEIRNFRQWDSRTPGHPERGHTPGVETTTGPLGQGFGNAVGMAIAERILADRFNRDGFEIVNHSVWGFCSDGDLMEGVSSEAASLAGHLRLGRLCMIYDDNHITIDGDTALAFSEDVGRRFEAYGWHVQHVGDGNDLDAIHLALEAARRETSRPSLIVLRTIIGNPAPTKSNTAAAHGSPLGKEEVKRTKEILGWPLEQFFIPEDALEHWREAVAEGEQRQEEWDALFERYAEAHPDLAGEYRRAMAGELPEGWEAKLPEFKAADGAIATRQASARTLKALLDAVPELVGGSADLSESTGTAIEGYPVFSPIAPGRLFHWGIREHAMTAAMNGMAAHGGVRPYGSTFLAFTDYAKPSIRLAAIMKLPIIFIGTHDSIGLGEDGPTHQPIEHLAMLRAVPRVSVFRPADANETVEAWRAAITRSDGPTVLVLTRQKLPILDRQKVKSAEGTRRGAYILQEPEGGPQAILIATGSEVTVALQAAELLAKDGIRARVVSMPSWDVFDQQDQAYRDEVLPPTIRARVGIEAASPFGWLKWVTEDGEMLAIDHFGASAPAEIIFKEFELTPAAAAAAVKRALGRTAS
ncbi:MAG TPA: transketolase [Gemmatimonadales bacterium]|nr:transketolase [Gemmatimonadales bacterium]